MEHKIKMKFSVIIPVYQSEKYITDCVKSVLNQSFDGSYEIILIDDGSLDSSGVIADDLAKQNEFVKSYHKTNGGAASARNYGLQKASGDYVLFIDGDDTVDPTLFQKLESFLNYDLLIYGMAFDYYLEDQLSRQDILSCKHEGSYSVEDIFNSYQDFFYDNALSSACNKVFRKDILEKHQINFNEKMNLYEDYDFVLQYFKYVDSVYFVNEPLYHYRHDLDHMHIYGRVKDLYSVKNNLSHLLMTIESLPNSYDKTGIHTVFCNLYMDLLQQNLMQNDYSEVELQKEIEPYISDKTFQSLLAAVKLSESNASLLKNMEEKQYKAILKVIKKKKRIRFYKDSIKKLIGKR